MPQTCESLSKNANQLLGFLNIRGGEFFACIGERNGTYYVLPGPTFNWDSRIDIESQRVVHPECIPELVDCGFLVFGEHRVPRSYSDYVPAGLSFGGVNRVYTLTDEGKKEGARLLSQSTAD